LDTRSVRVLGAGCRNSGCGSVAGRAWSRQWAACTRTRALRAALVARTSRGPEHDGHVQVLVKLAVKKHTAFHVKPGRTPAKEIDEDGGHAGGWWWVEVG